MNIAKKEFSKKKKERQELQYPKHTGKKVTTYSINLCKKEQQPFLQHNKIVIQINF